MKSLTKRTLSFIISLLLIVSCIAPCIVLNAGATEFTAYSADVDFSQYTLLGYTQNGNKYGNVYRTYGATAGDVERWSIVEDSTATGGKYLQLNDNPRYYTGNWEPMYMCIINPTGESQDTGTYTNKIRLESNTTYRIRLRYKVSDLDGSKYDIRFSAYATGGTTSANAITTANRTTFATGIKNTNGWVTGEYVFTTPTYSSTAKRIFALVMAAYSGTSLSSLATYKIAIDNVSIAAVSKVNIHNIDSEGNDNVKAVYGAPGEKVELDTAFEYYESYNSGTNTFSNKITGEKKFTNKISEDIYCFDDSFEPESYSIDFSKYTINSATGYNQPGNCRNFTKYSGTNLEFDSKWEILDDSTAKGSKVLHKYNYGQQTSEYLYNFILNPTGTATDAIALSKNGVYKVKIRQKINVQKATKALHLYLTHSTSGDNIHTSKTANIVKLDSFEVGAGTKNNDWVESTYYVTIPNYTSGTAPSLTLGLAPLTSSNTVYNDWGCKWDWYVDYVTVERASAVELYSEGSKIDTIYGVPDEVLNVSDLEKPRRTGYSFAGWFDDESLQISTSAITFKNFNLTKKIYAAWNELVSSAIINDETYPDSIRNDNNIYNGFSSSTQYKDGTSSFKSEKANAVMQLPANGTAIMLQDKGVYQMSFWYKSDKDTSVKFVTAEENSFENSVEQGSINLKASNEWKKAVLTFTANAASKDIFYLTASDADLYLDDIVLATVSTIVLDTKGGDALSDLKGEPGAEANLPTPVWAGHSFSGWYFDAECYRKASSIKYPTDIDTLTLYAGWDIKEPWVTVDFENEDFRPLANSNCFNKNKMAILEDEVGSFEGGKYLKYKHEKGSSSYGAASSSFAMYSNKNEYVKLENETTYSLSFWYKAESLSDDVRITAMTNVEYNFYLTSGQVNYSGNGYTVKASEQGSDWKRGTIYFTTDLKNYEKEGSSLNGKLCNMLFFRINVNSDADTVIYFDNITVDKLGDNDAIITKVLTSSSNEFVLSSKDSKLDLGVPTAEGYKFLGWYEDAAYTKPIENGTYTVKGHANLYAKWTLSYAKGSFEDYPVGWTSPDANGTGNNFRFPATSGMSLSENEAHSGSASARYHSDPSYKNPYSFMQLYNVNDIVVSGDIPLIVEEGKDYSFTIKYKLASSISDVKLALFVGHRNNCWGDSEQVGEYTISYADVGKGWQTATLFFTAKKKTKNNDALYLKITGDGKTTDIYLDDFAVESMDGKSYIEFKPNNGENSTYIVGSVGEEIGSVPSPKRTGYTFLGWHTDSELKDKFTGTVFGTSSLILYAKWTMNDEVVISFEDYYYRSSIVSMEKDCAEVSTDIASEGKYSMKIDKSQRLDRTNAGLVLVLNELPVTVENNTTYQITYDYYIKKNTATTNSTYTPWPNALIGAKGNMWLKHSVPAETWRFTLAEEIGVWKTASFMFTTELKSEQSNVLYFTVNATEGFIGYFDNIRITKVSRESDEYAVSLNPTGATKVGNTKLVYTGKSGERITLPSTIERKGYTFTGWYTNKKCTDKVQENTFSFGGFDQTLYAGWASLGFSQDFESFPNEPKGRYYYMDFDYEIYNASKEGNSKENVHGGKFSLHRIGSDFHNSAAQVITKELNATLSPGQVYKLSMWVKLESGTHTKGAISMACSSLMTYAWSVDGDWKNIVAISDLTDNEWHEVTYTFYATSNYLSILTPGYLNLYIDDISLELLEYATAEDCDTPVVCEEYIPVRIEDDKKQTITEADLDLELLKSVEKTDSSGISQTVGAIGIIVAIVAVVAGVSVASVLLIKRRKNRGE